MNILEAQTAFINQFDKIQKDCNGRELKGTYYEQMTQLHIVIPGYDFLVYNASGVDSTAGRNHFLNLFCDYVNGETNINASEMRWFEYESLVIVLWKIKED